MTRATPSTNYKVGDLVYFNAHPRTTNQRSYLCRGIVVRVPTTSSPVYKVIPTEVAHQENPPLYVFSDIDDLLGLKIPKPASGLTRTPALWYLKCYTVWIQMPAPQLSSLLDSIK